MVESKVMKALTLLPGLPGKSIRRSAAKRRSRKLASIYLRVLKDLLKEGNSDISMMHGEWWVDSKKVFEFLNQRDRVILKTHREEFQKTWKP